MLESGNFIPSIAFEDLLDCFGQKIISIRMPVTSDYYQINAPEYFGKTVLIDTSGFLGPLAGRLSAGALVHLPHDDFARILGRITAALKDGGLLLITLKEGADWFFTGCFLFGHGRDMAQLSVQGSGSHQSDPRRKSETSRRWQSNVMTALLKGQCGGRRRAGILRSSFVMPHGQEVYR
jgi:hypothetical protein